MTLGQRLYEMRKAKGLSQEKVAEILGVTRQTISKWETDQTTPDFDKIIPLCELYNISTDELLKGDTHSSNNYNNSRYDIPNENMQKDNSEQIEKYRRKSALLMAVSICLYILSVVPFFILRDGKIMITCFFVIIAVATMLIVFSLLSKPKRMKRTEIQTKELKLYKQISSILSGIILVIYLLVSFLTKAWYITWIIWVIYGILCEIIKLIFVLKGADINDEK
ncbi:MAG: helix-turn-helix domain-containing protein [Eubacterium sp.]|nr:helix-turn-helix domain-containing protein [Eubacterium sp.]